MFFFFDFIGHVIYLDNLLRLCQPKSLKSWQTEATPMRAEGADANQKKKDGHRSERLVRNGNPANSYYLLQFSLAVACCNEIN